MAEIFQICDRVTVMRDGRVQLSIACAEATMAMIVDSMLGTDQAEGFRWHDRGDHSQAPVVLSVAISSSPRASTMSVSTCVR